MQGRNTNEVILSKRDFLFGRKTPSKKTIAPPWAHAIENNCTACGDCIDACPENILTLGENRLPKVNFTLGECTFCGECADICKASVFLDRNADTNNQDSSPWDLTVSVSERCFLESKVYCRSCGDTCPERAIKFKLELEFITHITIDHKLCSGCGACVASCPRDAVSIQELQKQASIQNV